jgi:hypothetical protein
MGWLAIGVEAIGAAQILMVVGGGIRTFPEFAGGVRGLRAYFVLAQLALRLAARFPRVGQAVCISQLQ